MEAKAVTYPDLPWPIPIRKRYWKPIRLQSFCCSTTAEWWIWAWINKVLLCLWWEGAKLCAGSGERQSWC